MNRGEKKKGISNNPEWENTISEYLHPLSDECFLHAGSKLESVWNKRQFLISSLAGDTYTQDLDQIDLGCIWARPVPGHDSDPQDLMYKKGDRVLSASWQGRGIQGDWLVGTTTRHSHDHMITVVYMRETNRISHQGVWPHGWYNDGLFNSSKQENCKCPKHLGRDINI